MPKQVAPNGCAFCETLRSSHGSRGDGLHPPGVWTWVEPSDSVRLQRMKRNRQIRKGSAMGIANESWMFATIWYRSSSRPHLETVYTVSKVSLDGKSIMFKDEYGQEQWVAATAVEVIAFAPVVEAKPLNVTDSDLLDPHSGTIAAIDAEIKRLTDRLAELRTARQVISGL